MNRYCLVILAGLLLLTACNDDEAVRISEESVKKFNTFNAWMDNGANTRMQLTDGRHVTWQTNEKLGVFSDVQGITEYLITQGANSANATFTGNEVKGNTFYGFYPYDRNTSLDRNQHVVSFGFHPTVVIGNEGENLTLPIIAKSTNNNMQFKLLTGIFHISLTGTGTINSVELKGNNGELLGGMATVDYTLDEPVMKLTGQGVGANEVTKTLTASWNNAITLKENESLDLYFILPPANYSQGITMTMNMANGETVEKKANIPIVLNKGVTKHFTSLDVDKLIEEKHEVTVGFAFGGEMPSTTTDKDLFGLIVYDYNGQEIAQGLFNDPSKMQLALDDRKTYKVVATVIRNGKDLLYNKDEGFYQPLGTNDYATILKNNFASKNNSGGYALSVEQFGKGYSKMNDGLFYQYPATDRFYGEVVINNPTKESVVTIPMTCTAFGLRFEVTSVENGTLEVAFKTKDGKETLFSVEGITSAYKSDTKIITFDNVRAAWTNADDYSEEINVSAVWKKTSGDVKDLGSKTISVKRNRVTAVSLKATETGSLMGIVLDDTECINESANIHF